MVAFSRLKSESAARRRSGSCKKPCLSNCKQFTAVDKPLRMILPLRSGERAGMRCFFPPRMRLHGQRLANLEAFRQITEKGGLLFGQHARQPMSHAHQDGIASPQGLEFALPATFYVARHVAQLYVARRDAGQTRPRRGGRVCPLKLPGWGCENNRAPHIPPRSDQSPNPSWTWIIFRHDENSMVTASTNCSRLSFHRLR